MRKRGSLVSFCAVLLFALVACHKEGVTPDTWQERKIRYVLYTTRDFSSDNGSVTFTLIMKNGAQTLFDSALAPMKLKDIPDSNHKMVIEKKVPGNNPALLKVGFQYSIENVGTSWHYDSCSVGQYFKTVEFAFQ